MTIIPVWWQSLSEMGPMRACVTHACVCDLTHVYTLQMCVDALQAERGAIKRRGKASHTGRYET